MLRARGAICDDGAPSGLYTAISLWHAVPPPHGEDILHAPLQDDDGTTRPPASLNPKP